MVKMQTRNHFNSIDIYMIQESTRLLIISVDYSSSRAVPVQFYCDDAQIELI